MNFHLNLQPLVSRPDKKADKPPAKRSYLATYSYGTGLHRITIKAVDRFTAHDIGKEQTPNGMVFTALREVKKPVRRKKAMQ